MPLILDVPARLRGQSITQGAFVNEFYASFSFPQSIAAGNLMLALIITAVIMTVMWSRLIRHEQATHWLITAWTAGMLLMGGAWALMLTILEASS